MANNWYPAKALDLGKQGSASIRCTVEHRRGRDCVILREKPSSFSFGALAVRAAAKLDLPKGSEGVETELVYRWTMLTPGCHRDIVNVDPIWVITHQSGVGD